METIRKAGVADAEAMARISRETFAAAFGQQYSTRDLELFLEDGHTPAKARAELANPDVGVWLLEEDGRAVGYVLAGPCKLDNPDVTPHCGEIHRMYLLPEYQGGGRGQRMMEAALDWLEARGRRRVWLGVFSGNEGAQRFYHRLGFRKVGEHTFRVGTTVDREFTFRRG